MRYDNLKPKNEDNPTYIDVNKRYLKEVYTPPNDGTVPDYEFRMDASKYEEIINFRFISNFIRATNTIFFYCGLTLVMQLLYKKYKKRKQTIYI